MTFMDQDIPKDRGWVGDLRQRLQPWLWPLTMLICLASSIFSAILSTKIIEKTQSPAEISISYPDGLLELPEIKPAIVPKKQSKAVPIMRKSTKTKKPTSVPTKADKT